MYFSRALSTSVSPPASVEAHKERCQGTHRSSHDGSQPQVVEDAFSCLLALSSNFALLSLLTDGSEHLRHTSSRQACPTTPMQRRPSSTTHRSTASRSKSEPLQPIHMTCAHSNGSLHRHSDHHCTRYPVAGLSCANHVV